MDLPAGYFYKDGAYWAADDGTGPYGFDGTSMFLLGSGSGGLNAQPYYFSAAGTYIIALGPATAYSIFLTASVVGTVQVYDNTAASGPSLLGSTATAIASNVSIPIGAPPGYGSANTGICLVITGANVGYLTFGSR